MALTRKLVNHKIATVTSSVTSDIRILPWALTKGYSIDNMNKYEIS